MGKTFATAINCIDGRVQKPVIEFVRKEWKVDYVDLVTEPRPDLILSEGTAADVIESIQRRVRVSVEKHASRTIVIAGHHDCAANPVDELEHHQQIRKAASLVTTWAPDAEVCGIWVDEKWRVSVVHGEA